MYSEFKLNDSIVFKRYKSK